MWYKNAGTTFFRSVTIHAFDRQTDRILIARPCLHSMYSNTVKINDVLIIDTFKNDFQRRSSEVLLPDVRQVGTIQKLHSKKGITGRTCWLIFCR